MTTFLRKFELLGPRCEIPGCTGVLVDTISWKDQTAFHRCATCGSVMHKMTLREKTEAAVRTIKRVMSGIKPD